MGVLVRSSLFQTLTDCTGLWWTWNTISCEKMARPLISLITSPIHRTMNQHLRQRYLCLHAALIHNRSSCCLTGCSLYNMFGEWSILGSWFTTPAHQAAVQALDAKRISNQSISRSSQTPTETASYCGHFCRPTGKGAFKV